MAKKQPVKKSIKKQIVKTVKEEINSPNLDKLKSKIQELSRIRGSKVFPLLTPLDSIDTDLVDKVYNALRTNFKGSKKLDVLVMSSGGDIHSAYQLAKIFRNFAKENLTFIVPKYAKSAATLLVCGGDKIIFGPTSELGPLDPQIGLEEESKEKTRRRFSPLAIRPTLDLIAEESGKKHDILVEKLSASLPPALILGQYLKTLEVGKEYIVKLLTTRMLKADSNAVEKATKIGESLIKSYPDHGWCLDFDEVKNLGLSIEWATEKEWNLIWEIYSELDKILTQAFAEKSEDKEKKIGIIKEKMFYMLF